MCGRTEERFPSYPPATIITLSVGQSNALTNGSFRNSGCFRRVPGLKVQYQAATGSTLNPVSQLKVPSAAPSRDMTKSALCVKFHISSASKTMIPHMSSKIPLFSLDCDFLINSL